MDKVINRVVTNMPEEFAYSVGVDGVTRIEAGGYCPEPYCERLFYQVYKGDKLHATVNDSAAGVIIYD